MEHQLHLVSGGRKLIAIERNQGGAHELSRAQDCRGFFADRQRQFRDCAGRWRPPARRTFAHIFGSIRRVKDRECAVRWPEVHHGSCDGRGLAVGTGQ